MKKTILVYGLIAGTISAILLMAFSFNMATTDPTRGMVIGFASMILAFSLIYFAIATHKKNSGGYISFGNGLKIGLGIVVITCVFYSLAWLLTLEFFIPDFAVTYTKTMVENMRTEGKSQAEIAKSIKFMNDIYGNKLYIFLFTMLEPLPVGLIITLIASLILKGGKPKPVMSEMHS